MKTKVIISGGYADEPNGENKKFFQEILADTPENLTILIIPFSQPPEKIETKTESVKSQFESVKENKTLQYLIGTHENLEEQIQQTDIIYIRGGQTLKLVEEMKQHPNFINLIKGKVIAGESAGTYLLSNCFYSKTEGGIFSGLGFLPIKTICHFEGMNAEKLEECSDELETVLLKDFEHKVYWV